MKLLWSGVVRNCCVFSILDMFRQIQKCQLEIMEQWRVRENIYFCRVLNLKLLMTLTCAPIKILCKVYIVVWLQYKLAYTIKDLTLGKAWREMKLNKLKSIRHLWTFRWFIKLAASLKMYSTLTSSYSRTVSPLYSSINCPN